MKTLLAAALLLAGAAGPFDIALLSTPAAPDARGSARLVYSASPFGIAVTAEGVSSYDVQLDLSGLPEPASLGAYSTYVAWAATPDLSRWYRLGTVANGVSRIGRIQLDKFLFVITAEADSAPASRAGPTVLHGISPSAWLQSFVSHPLFRGIPPE